MFRKMSILFCSFFIIFSLVACSEQKKEVETQKSNATDLTEDKPVHKDSSQTKKPEERSPAVKKVAQPAKPQATTKPINTSKPVVKVSSKKPTAVINKDSIQVIAKPEAIPVLVNKKYKLPDNYSPKDLVYTTIPFIFKNKTDKKKMRSEAATAIGKLFDGAKKQGVTLLGVSAYRSHSTQVSLFNYYVKKDGYVKARTYSALPGTSEHETGLAIDVTGGNGKCAAQDCFTNTKEANWLQANVAEYGFIIRYPKGKDAITGYKYEPWHLRYVGITIAKEIMTKGITLEEYYHTIPVSN